MSNNTIHTKEKEKEKAFNTNKTSTNLDFLPQKTFYDYKYEQKSSNSWLDDLGWI